jgi:hypothetical protein
MFPFFGAVFSAGPDNMGYMAVSGNDDNPAVPFSIDQGQGPIHRGAEEAVPPGVFTA